MATIITQSEYEKKFGIKPFVAPPTEDVVDTKPAPIVITQSEWRKMQNQSVTESPLQNPFAASRDRIKDIPSDFREFWQGSKDAVTEGFNTQKEARRQVEAREITPVSGTVKTLGGGVLAGAKVIGEAFIGALKLSTTPKTEEYVARKLSPLGAEFTEMVKSDMEELLAELENSDNPDKQLVASQINSLISDYETNPDFKAQVDGYGGMATAVAEVFGLGKGKNVLTNTLKDAGSLGDNVVGAGADSLSAARETVTNALDARSAAKRQQELFDIENSYSKLRKDKGYSADENAGSRARIADANIWDNVVDTDGNMTTMGKGGAYNQYEAATISGRESVVRDNLVREGATVNINELARALKTNIADSGLEGAALAKALAGVQREIKAFSEGLSKRTDEFGNIPLEKVQDFKTSTTKTINYKTDNNPTITFKKAKAQTYREVVENKSKTNVKEINAELAKYYQDLELIKSLDGRKVRGGKLGKYFAQISGNMIGGAAGMAVGGPAGMAVGTVVGGEAAALIKGRTMSASLGKGGKGVPANPVLDAARKEAGLPPVKDLKTPDKPLGAPKGITKTKEIIKVEGQIKNNVTQQKAAIKDGNFALVADLKEVFAYLVTQLKTLVRETKESIKNPTIGLSVKREGVPKGTTFSDLVTMRDYTDMVYNKNTKLPAETVKGISDEMDAVARKLKLNNAYGGESALAKEAQTILGDAKFDEVSNQSKSDGKRNTQYNKSKTTSKTVIDPTVDGKDIKVNDASGDKTTLLEEAKGLGKTKPQFHGSANIIDGKLKPSDAGILGKGFYMTGDESVAKSFAQTKNLPVEEQLDGLQKVRDTSIKPNIYSVDTSKVKLKELDDADGLINYLNGRSMDTVRLNLIKEGFDGISLTKRGESVVFPEMLEKIKVELKTKSN